MSNAIYEKFIDLKKKANFWLELTRSLPHVCPSQCWKQCFEKSFTAHEKVQICIEISQAKYSLCKLWNFQLEKRKYLESEKTFTREQIGDIAWNIASTYFHYYIRCVSKDFLKRSILFFEAILERGYYENIKTTDKYRQFLICYAQSCFMANEMNRSRNIIRQITDFDHPIDNSQSFVFSQPSMVLNDIENLLQVSHDGKFFERGQVESFLSFQPNGHCVSSFLSLSTSKSNLYGELTISNVLLSGLLCNFKFEINQFFVKDPSAITCFSAILFAIAENCMKSTDILLLHIDTPTRKTLSGDTILYFDNADPQVSDDDKTLSISDLRVAKRNIILISESYFQISELIIDSVFIFVPFNSSFWTHNPILLLYSTEFLFYEFYIKIATKSNDDKRGKIENITRIHSQIYLKFFSEIVASSFESEKSKYSWILNCPIGRWLEFKRKSIHLKCPIQNLLPQKLDTIHLEVYKFLESLTGIS